MTFNREIFTHWMPKFDSKRAVLAVSGLAMVGGLVAGPASAAHAADTAPVKATAVTATQIVEQADAKDKAKKADAPSVKQLMTRGVPSDQSTYEMTPERMANAKAIIEAGKEMNLPPRAWVIAIATSLQESKLDNLGHLGDMNDHDSLGL
ncbi:hypothetical protein AB0J06_24380, partial [Micromonospora sp. NPDC049679]